jgi:hypothetical protein
MSNTKRWFSRAVASFVVSVFSLHLLSGCATSPTVKGTVIGAVAGAALGTGTGLLISDDKLLGSKPQSKLELDRGAAVGASVLIGAVFGAIVGAMIGHQNEDPWKPTPEPQLAAARQPAPTPTAYTSPRPVF